MTVNAESIFKVIAYFDVFNYPVKQEELRQFADIPIGDQAVAAAVKELIHLKLIWQLGEFYSLRNNAALVERRLKGNKLAARKLKLAGKVANVLSWFPFVRGVAVSGSLSKQFADKESDLDFFIIVAPNRLWIGRSFLFVMYKIAKLAGLQNWFCLNYFIDETALEIKEKNFYTAIEISTLLPTEGKNVFNNFMHSNKWVNAYLPNYKPIHYTEYKMAAVPLKKMFERLFNNRTGDKLDNWLMKFFARRWSKIWTKEKVFVARGIKKGELALGKHYCKPNPHYFQKKILLLFEQRMNTVKALQKAV